MPAMQARPPDVIEKRALVSDATAPASMSPSRGPLVTTSENTDDIRPRMRVRCHCLVDVERQTALTLSAAPAMREQRRRGPQRADQPGSRDRRPHASTAAITIRPRRRACSSQPVVSAATVAPAETAANKQPGPGGARVVDADREHREQRTRHAEGHRDEVDREGAHERLVAAHEPQALADRAADRERLLARRRRGSCGAARVTLPTIARQLARVDRVGGLDAEPAAMSRPPRPGPITIVSWNRPNFSASALASAGLDEVGHDRRAHDVLRPRWPASRPPRTKRTQMARLPRDRDGGEPGDRQRSPSWSTSSSCGGRSGLPAPRRAATSR